MATKRQMALARWANQIQLPPDGYEPIPGSVSKRRFAVCLSENASASPGERYTVSAARVSVLEGRDTPLPGEPFTSYFSRSNIAEREYARLVETLG
ncbi:MAG: hypothetical protein H0U02_13030 [Rubrobacter sp.]|nr:hypothetical protein [Rubrobacter sp.]